VAAKQYQAIYDGAAPEFRAATPQPLVAGMLQRVDRKLGDCKPAQRDGNWSGNSTTSGYFQTLGFTQSCANGALTWSVTVVVRAGKAQLTGFNAKSQLLLTD
jgi:hypothetical protein